MLWMNEHSNWILFKRIESKNIYYTKTYLILNCVMSFASHNWSLITLQYLTKILPPPKLSHTPRARRKCPSLWLPHSLALIYCVNHKQTYLAFCLNCELSEGQRVRLSFISISMSEPQDYLRFDDSLRGLKVFSKLLQSKPLCITV